LNFLKRYPVALCIALLFVACVAACNKGRSANNLGVEEAVGIATDAYIYGYPLVTMDTTRRQLTNVATPDAARAPMGQLLRLRAYPAIDNHTVPAPNTDTLYTTAWIDVSKEPWVLSIPDMGNRYYMMPMLDGWTNVFQVPGSRTTGRARQEYAITGPGWTGSLPAGVTEYKSSTAMVWVLGRIYCTGTPEDYTKVHALQDKFSLVPLSSYGKPYTPPVGQVDASVDKKTSVRDQVDHMGVDEFFNYLAQLMKSNPPAPEDAPMVVKMARIGLIPGQDFDPSKLGVFDEEVIKTVPKLAQLKIVKSLKDSPLTNGWWLTTKTGVYGTDYMQRATIAAFGLGANRPQDAIYPVGMKSGDDKELDAASDNYVVHFDKGQMPPAKAFWSLTMYDKDFFFVPNRINRYTLSSRNKFVANSDGSVDLYLQAGSPGKAKEANWLPAPKAKFVPMLRLYWPNDVPPSIIDGTWKPPAITATR